MKYSKIIYPDVLNGPGTRVTIFVSGCEHKCKGCYNASTWNPDFGNELTDEVIEGIINTLNDTRIKYRGLSISGGDPLHPNNVDRVLDLVKRVKNACNNKDIWLWTGYTYEELSERQRAILSHIDVIVDGKFVQEEYSPKLYWKGSKNQRVLNSDGSTHPDNNKIIGEKECLQR